jgi:hypothetical protein
VIGLLGALLLATAGPGVASAQVETTFDTDLGGWTILGDNTFFWNPTDGNPDGCLEVVDDAAGPWSVAIAPDTYLGDWSAMTAADSLAYDAIHMPSAGQNGNPPYVFRIEGPGGSAEFEPGSFPADQWNHLAVPIDSTGWNVKTGNWTELVENVVTLSVAAEMISGNEVVRIDNIRLDGTPQSTFRACEVETFEVGLAGWIGDGASISRIDSDGDVGGFLQVTEQGGSGRVVAPAWYYGDWSAMNGGGSIGFSFTFLANDVEPGGGQIRVELAGPGGSAVASTPSDPFAPRSHLWKVLSWPLDASAWNVTSGTWAGLLADVRELAISADISPANQRFGLDNLWRGGAGCLAEPGTPITLHEPGYSVCGFTRFHNASALALNPADGEFYALVNKTISSGGGVYVVTGPDAGLRRHSISLPTGLVFTADGDGFVTDNNAGILYRFVGTDSLMTWADEFAAGDDDPAGLIVAPPGFEGPNVTAGDLLVTDHGNSGLDAIWAVSADSANGERLLVDDPGNADWYDLATDGTTVWACDLLDDDALWIVQPDGNTSLLALSQNVTNMRALAYDAGQGFLYALKTSNPPGLYRIDPGSGQVTLIADDFDTFGYGNLEIDAASRRLWVADEDQSRIWEICLPAAGVAVGEPDVAPRPLALSLRPHPVVDGTSISLDLPRESPVRIDILDLAGRRVRTLEPGVLPAGPVSVSWDARNGSGRRVAAGVYFVRVRAADEVRTRKAVVLR